MYIQQQALSFTVIFTPHLVYFWYVKSFHIYIIYVYTTHPSIHAYNITRNIWEEIWMSAKKYWRCKVIWFNLYSPFETHKTHNKWWSIQNVFEFDINIDVVWHIVGSIITKTVWFFDIWFMQTGTNHENRLMGSLKWYVSRVDISREKL